MKLSKQEKVKRHLLKHRSITSWEAIQNYSATRLAAIIFGLRKNGWKIESTPISEKRDDESGNATRYVLIADPKKHQL
jgi:Helix-turn-helix domain